MRPFEASRPRRSLPAIRRLVAAIVVLLAAESTALAADPTMFEGARAMHALEAIVAQAGHKPRFLGIDITAEELTAEIQDPADPSRIVTWRVSQPGMLRSWLCTTAAGNVPRNGRWSPAASRKICSTSIRRTWRDCRNWRRRRWPA